MKASSRASFGIGSPGHTSGPFRQRVDQTQTRFRPLAEVPMDLVAGSSLAFEDRGEHQLKGVPQPWRINRVVP